MANTVARPGSGLREIIGRRVPGKAPRFFKRQAWGPHGSALSGQDRLWGAWMLALRPVPVTVQPAGGRAAHPPVCGYFFSNIALMLASPA